MLKLPIGIQNFEKLRTDDCAYVDKTASLYELAKNKWCYFLSRPRRFGKSLLLSTLKSFFQGKKELFEGLAIAELEQSWETYPVLYIDLNVGIYTSTEGLWEALNSNLSILEKTYGIAKETNDNAQRFRDLIWNLATKTGKKVVILVDEYDKPLLQAIDNEPLQQDFRNILKAFYSNLKTCDEYIRFAMLTGVSKFSKISLFSDLNNLTDISLDERYADICGLISDEIEHHFSEHLEAFAQKEGTDKATVMEEMRKMYDTRPPSWKKCERCMTVIISQKACRRVCIIHSVCLTRLTNAILTITGSRQVHPLSSSNCCKTATTTCGTFPKGNYGQATLQPRRV